MDGSRTITLRGREMSVSESSLEHLTSASEHVNLECLCDRVVARCREGRADMMDRDEVHVALLLLRNRDALPADEFPPGTIDAIRREVDGWVESVKEIPEGDQEAVDAAIALVDVARESASAQEARQMLEGHATDGLPLGAARDLCLIALSWMQSEAPPTPATATERLLEAFVYRPVLLRLRALLGAEKTAKRMKRVLDMVNDAAA